MSELYTMVPDRGDLFSTDVMRRIGLQRCGHCGEVVPLENKLCPDCDSYLPEHIVPSNCHTEPVGPPTNSNTPE